MDRALTVDPDADLEAIFEHLDRRLKHLSLTLGKTRAAVVKVHKARQSDRCLVCKKLSGPAAGRCLQRCAQPRVVHFEELAQEFPVDVKRLRVEGELHDHFRRHQTDPVSIADTDHEANWIVSLYAMPIATAAIPDESWARSIEVVKGKPDHMRALLQKWMERADDYSPEAQDELARKLVRNDPDQTILRTLSDEA